jgi:hypothetical protein
MRAKYTVADVLNRHQEDLNGLVPNSWKSRALHALRKCRTIELGGHIDACDCCNDLHLSYNSCRNRHCPTCQGHKREQWIAKRSEELLNIPYYHVVFTMPDELNTLCLQNPKLLYATLFKTAWETLKGFAENPKNLGAKTGMIALLHTWGQNLQLHPHLHCIVPAGGVLKNGDWKMSKNKGNFLFCVKEMSKVYCAKFVANLPKEKAAIPQKTYDILFEKKWVVYAKKAFVKPQYVIEYLGRYSHKIAISNHRILAINNQTNTVTFSLKNYKKKGKKETMTLAQTQFIKRFSLHILPKGFTRIRHYGILSGTWKKKHLQALQEQLNGMKTGEKSTTINDAKSKHLQCPNCKQGTLTPIFVFSKARPPPAHLLKRIAAQKATRKRKQKKIR